MRTIASSVGVVFVLLTPILTRPVQSIDSHIIHVNFDNITAVSKTTATLQVVSNPILDKKYSPVASTLYDNLAELNADLVRYAAWYPYPIIGVAELDPPNATSRTTSWHFSEELQQMFLDVWKAVVRNGNRLVITFSTQPTWMFNTTDWSYSNDTSVSDWGYPKGRWIPSTTKLVSEYYARFASWLVKGDFKDEFGNTVRGGPALGLGDDGGVTHWEVFNEPEGEHNLQVTEYNDMYDAIVREIRKAVDPNHTIEFFGMALGSHRNWDWWNGYLSLNNHAPDVRDAVANGYASFHFYASMKSRTNVSGFMDVWEHLDDFLEEVDEIIHLRDTLSPTTKLAVNEAGVIPPQDNEKGVEDSPQIYYNMVAALYTVLLLELSAKSVDLVGSSQYCGCPAMPEWNIPNRQYPGVSMTNWTTGNGNPRYWALKMYNAQGYFGPGDRIVHSTSSLSSSQPQIFVQGRITKDGRPAIILVNKSYLPQIATLPITTANDSSAEISYHVSIVDETTHDGPWKEFATAEKTLKLKPFAVAVVHIINGVMDGNLVNSFS
jgi:hypothetical protein